MKKVLLILALVELQFASPVGAVLSARIYPADDGTLEENTARFNGLTLSHITPAKVIDETMVEEVPFAWSKNCVTEYKNKILRDMPGGSQTHCDIHVILLHAEAGHFYDIHFVANDKTPFSKFQVRALKTQDVPGPPGQGEHLAK